MRPRAAWPLLCLLAFALAGCASLPQGVVRTPSQALPADASTRLGLELARPAAAAPGQSGVHALYDGKEAMAARVILARAAERSLDVQYYIWRDDVTGGLISDALFEAAERGVRVRLLLDDMNKGHEAMIGALDAHPNIEVRLFNPFANRGMRMLDFMGDFARVNRRMHNKSFTADNQASIVGGRNVGDEYFGATSAVAFADLDVLLTGAVVPRISASFDDYWNADATYPLAALAGSLPADEAARVRQRLARVADEPRAQAYVAALQRTALVQDVIGSRFALEWTGVTLVADDPAKILQSTDPPSAHILGQIGAALGQPQSSLDIVSPYFVPGEGGTRFLAGQAERGIAVRVLTNSLAATDVAAVHAGYARQRRPLLEAGVRVYELKASAFDKPGTKSLAGSSGASLHAKTFGVDQRRIFVGSLNLDPRSVHLNTELGVVIESPSLATRLAGAFDGALKAHTYEATLAPDAPAGLAWIDRAAPDAPRLTSEPDAGFWRKLSASLVSLLPVEWLL